VSEQTAEPERDWTTGLPMSERERDLARARVAAAEARRVRDEPVKRAISGEPHGEYDPVTGRFIRSRWRMVP
jgi:hypothetical protein